MRKEAIGDLSSEMYPCPAAKRAKSECGRYHKNEQIQILQCGQWVHKREVPFITNERTRSKA
jgi:hypothetical protein